MPGKVKIEPCSASWTRPYGSDMDYLGEFESYININYESLVRFSFTELYVCVCLSCTDEEMITDQDMNAESVNRLVINVISPLDILSNATKVFFFDAKFQLAYI